jgi:hypothetical protein
MCYGYEIMVMTMKDGNGDESFIYIAVCRIRWRYETMINHHSDIHRLRYAHLTPSPSVEMRQITQARSTLLEP